MNNLVLWFGVAALFVVSASAEQPTTVRVLGSAVARAEPEHATFMFGVVTYAPDADRAAQENAQQTRATIAALKERLGPEARIETAGYAIQPNRKYSKIGLQDVKGYSVTNTLQVTVEQVADLGDILDHVTASGADGVYSVNFGVSDPAALRGRAVQEAVAQAQVNAEAIAKALGQRVLRIVSVEEGSTQAHPYSVGGVTETISVGPTPIVASAVERHATVTVTAEIGP